jgi:hypothetical protein
VNDFPFEHPRLLADCPAHERFPSIQADSAASPFGVNVSRFPLPTRRSSMLNRSESKDPSVSRKRKAA